jgi:hypothetical protein
MEMMRRLLRPVHSWVWLDTARRARKLLRFPEIEADGGILPFGALCLSRQTRRLAGAHRLVSGLP